ncbi:MAG: CAP domain-containing protein [Myxococcota bacterium]|nr:CAP domain-containing protein [Myxococcota bacterium]MEC9442674.1 CAP domain-containing protein [Myxococcota bacterium]
MPKLSPLHATLAALLILSILACGGSDTPDPIPGSQPEANNSQSSQNNQTTPQSNNGACSSEGAEIVALVNAERAKKNLPAIPLSPSMCKVASIHTRDLADNSPVSGECNLHSWSDKGSWTACCYTSDHAQAECMWKKPGELTDYPGFGYENSAAGVSTADAAVGLWMNSSGHRGVILEEGIWQGANWQSLGADMHGGYAVLWFGKEPDN